MKVKEMIDVHCHILPQVDDGPISYDEAMKMVALAYEDGVRCIVATPHLNHPYDFVPHETIENTYFKLRRKITDKYKEFGLVLGSELYITKDYLELLKNKPYHFTMGDSNYVLIEFDRNIKHREVMDIVHEFIIKDYRPIIAHIEMYADLVSSIEKVRSIRNEGAYIQITASSLLGKQSSDVMQFLRKMVRLGLVDFIASDGHKYDARRPLLKDAYNAVQNILSSNDAKRIFETNPKSMIVGKHIPQPSYNVKSGSSKLIKLNLIAASIAAVLIASTFLFSLYNRDEALATENQNTEILNQVMDEFDLDKVGVTAPETDELTTSASEEISTEITTESTTTGTLPINTEPIPNTKSDIENVYFDALSALQNDYVYKLEDIVENIKVAKANISDETQRKSIIEGYIQEIVTLEELSDNTVYDLLYKMQNNLEAKKYSVETVQKYRDAYHAVKENKQAAYLKALGY